MPAGGCTPCSTHSTHSVAAGGAHRRTRRRRAQRRLGIAGWMLLRCMGMRCRGTRSTHAGPLPSAATLDGCCYAARDASRSVMRGASTRVDLTAVALERCFLEQKRLRLCANPCVGGRVVGWVIERVGGRVYHNECMRVCVRVRVRPSTAGRAGYSWHCRVLTVLTVLQGTHATSGYSRSFSTLCPSGAVTRRW